MAPTLTVHVIYRASPGVGKNRPADFSKGRCLLTLLRSAEGVDGARLTFLVDGVLPPRVLAVMEANGDVDVLDGIGNCGSYLRALDVALNDNSDKDLVYLCEDDYLHTPDALEIFAGAAVRVPPGTYLTLYDHPDRYRRRDDLRIPGRQVEIINGRHWRAVESCAMTFGSQVQTLSADESILRMAARFTRYPHDRAMWRTVQGLGARAPLRWRRGDRRLLSPMPGRATHVEVGACSAGVAWAEVTAEAREWGAANGFDLPETW